MDKDTNNFLKNKENQNAFHPLLTEMIESGIVVDKFGQERKADTISTVNNLQTIAAIIQEIKPKKTLEIGLCYGASALLMTNILQQLGQSPSGQHYAIDPFQRRDWGDTGLFMLEKANLRNYLTFYENFSALQLPEFVQQKLQFDLIYIDGSHLFEDVFVDMYYCIELLSPQGIVLLDDCTDPHIKKVVKFARKNWANLLTPINLAPYSQRKGFELKKYQLAAQLDKVQLRAFRKKTDKSRREWNDKFIPF